MGVAVLAGDDTGVAEVPSVSCPSHTNGHAPNNPTSAHVFIPRIDIFTRPARPSTSLQESVHFLGQFTSDSFGRGNFIDARFPKPVHRSKLPQQNVLPVLADAGTIIQH